MRRHLAGTSFGPGHQAKHLRNVSSLQNISGVNGGDHGTMEVTLFSVNHGDNSMHNHGIIMGYQTNVVKTMPC